MNRQPYVAPVQPHWFYLRSNEEYWFPFSVIDSSKLEEAYIRSQADESLQMVIPTDGGRYDVSLKERRKHAIYWDEPIANVRRCTWFYKGNNHHWYMPYDEDTADKLEETFVNALINNNWNCQVTLSSGEVVIMHSPVAMAHYPAHQSQPLNYEIDYQPKSVLRGFLERDKVGFGEDKPVDHVVFVVHGAGPLSDDGVNSFKSLIDCVDDFREVAQLMLKTHKSIGGQSPTKGRVEFLPIHWHSPLLTETNIHTQVNDISPLTIGKLRDFTSKILADILLYSSPFCLQKAIDHISREMNRMMELFQQRNPKFSGDVAIMGHSVGSCIVYDLLTHQGINEVSAAIVSEDISDSLVDEEKTEVIPSLEDALAQLGLSQITDKFHNEMIDFDSLIMCTDDDLKDISVPLGARKKLNPFIAEWKGKIHKTQTDQVIYSFQL
jgi:phospholipase DDHD2